MSSSGGSPRDAGAAGVEAEEEPELYATLGVSRGASDEEIKRAYRRLALRHHPDKLRLASAAERESSDALFKRVGYAYSVLSEPSKRRYYDEHGDAGGGELEVTPEDFVRTFQVTMAKIMGGVSVREMVDGLSEAELAAMPPFPFPRELFPPGTFPEGMRFSSEGLAELPPQVEAMLASGEAMEEIAAAGMSMFSSAEEMSSFGRRGGRGLGAGLATDEEDEDDEDWGGGDDGAGAVGEEDEEEMMRMMMRMMAADGEHPADDDDDGDEEQQPRRRRRRAAKARRAAPSPGAGGARAKTKRGSGGGADIMSEILSEEFLQQMASDPMFRGMPPAVIERMIRSVNAEDPSVFADLQGSLHEDDDEDDDDDDDEDGAARRSTSPPASPAAVGGAPLPGSDRLRRWMDAAKAGDALTVREMLATDPALLRARGPGVGHTALHWAAARGEAGTLTVLLRAGAHASDLNSERSTPLHSAAAHGHAVCAERLLRSCATPHDAAELTRMRDADRKTAGDLAAARGHAEVASALRSAAAGARGRAAAAAGAKAPPAPAAPAPATPACASSPGRVDARGTDCGTDGAGAPASAGTAAPAAREPIPAAGARSAPAAGGRSAAGVACSDGRRWLAAARAGDLACLRAMLSANPRLLAYRGQGSSYGFTGGSALHWAASAGRLDVMSWLIEQGAPVDLPNCAGSLPLHAAAANARPRAAELLVLAGGAGVRVPDALGETPREVAAGRGLDAVVRAIDASERARPLLEASGGGGAWGVREMRQFLAVALGPAEVAGASEKADLVRLTAAALAERGYGELRRIVPLRTLAPADVAPIGEEEKAPGDGAGRRGHDKENGRDGEAEPAAPGAARSDGAGSVAALARQRGNEAFRAGEYARAAVQFSMLIRLDPKSAVGYSNRSGAYAKQGLWQRALEDAERCVKLSPDWGKAHARRGAALVGLGQAGEGVKAYAKGLAVAPGDAALTEGLRAAKAEIQRQQQRYEDMWGRDES